MLNANVLRINVNILFVGNMGPGQHPVKDADRAITESDTR